MGGIPRILPPELLASERRTADTFATAWNHYGPHLSPVLNADFLPVCRPWTKELFAGKTVLDVGCGAGRLSRMACAYGANVVVSVDLGGAVDVACRLASHPERNHFVQASAFELPFKNKFDIVICLGVVHHTPDPGRAFDCLVSQVKEGGRLGVWVYGVEGNEIMGPLMNFFRVFTTRLSVGVRMRLASILVTGEEWYYSFSKKLGLPIFYRDYLRWFNDSQNRVDREYVAFDFLSSPLVRYIPRADVEGWVARNNLTQPVINRRNGNSWSLTAVKTYSTKLVL